MKLNLRRVLLLFTLIPLISCVFTLAIISITMMDSHLEENTFAELKVAAQGLRSYYEYDIQNEYNIVDNFVEYDTEEYIDQVHGNTDVDLTLFKENVRFMTSLLNKDGTRNEGTKASTEVWNTVRKNNDYYSNDVVINDVDYYVYYMPLLDKDRRVAGMAFAGIAADTINSAKRSTMLFIFGLSTALIVVFIIIALLISPKISNPIKDAATNLRQLSNGDTNVKLNTTTHIVETKDLCEDLTTLGNSLNSIAKAMNSGIVKLDNKVVSTTENASNVSNEMNTIASAMNSIATGTVEMSSNIQNLNSDAKDMENIINNAVAAVNELEESTTKITKANTGASKYISDINESSKESAKAINDIVKSILDTSNAVDSINEMTKLITDIASQTNLLSLNASIEAARAGEAGRGFSVVAQEISKLAQDSNDSAKQIKETVSTINKLSNTCVEQAEKVKAMIDTQQNILTNVVKQFDVLNGEIDSSVNNISKVADVTDKLQQIKQTIVNAITALSAVAEQATATNQEVVSTTETIAVAVNNVSEDMNTMTELSSQLKDSISFFKM